MYDTYNYKVQKNVCVLYHFLFKFHKINTKISDYKQKCGMFYVHSVPKIFIILSFVPFFFLQFNVSLCYQRNE